MNYIAMIQNRRSVRAFRGKEVSGATLAELRTHYEINCRRLIPEIATELVILDADAQSALEGAAGYQQFLIGAPFYRSLRWRSEAARFYRKPCPSDCRGR